jgi:hypothetical protein
MIRSTRKQPMNPTNFPNEETHMGVEYQHYLAVEDLLWRPQRDTAIRVDAVLRKWNLVHGLTSAVTLDPDTRGEQINIDQALQIDPGNGLLFDWMTEETDSSGIARVTGGSIFGDAVPEDSRFIQRIALLIGHDLFVHPSSESVSVEVTQPPMLDGVEMESVELDDCTNYFLLEGFPGSAEASFPEVEVTIEDGRTGDERETQFAGFWRGALMWDFGKDVAEFAGDTDLLPERQFVADVEEAFRAKIIEVGQFS